jgi:hypothetical protein
MNDNDTDPVATTSPPRAERRSMSSTQADGLRAMFGQGEPLVYCVASALPPDATVTLGLGTAHALRRGGHLTLLVDEVPLFERQSLKGFTFPVRFDLGQVFSGSVALNRVLRKVADNLWFATGVKVRGAIDSKRVRGPSLVKMLQRTELDFEFVVVATCEPFGSSMACYGETVQRIVVAAPDDASLTRALAHVRELSIISGGEAVPVLLVGGADAGEGRAAFDRLANASQQLLEQPLDFLGWVRSASASAFGEDSSDQGITLPVSLYQMLAGRMLYRG